MLYARLDDLRERASARRAAVLRQTGGTHQARLERDNFTVMYGQQLAQLNAAENGLCFGRLEFDDGELRYIGRLGMHADSDDYDQLLMDWRADAARPFYLATAASPGDVRVRRHLRTKGRKLVSLDDEVLDLAARRPVPARGPDRGVRPAGGAERQPDRRDDRHRRDDPGRAGQDHPSARCPASSSCKAAPAPARPRSHCTARPSCSTRSGVSSRSAVYSSSDRTSTFLRYIGQVLPSLGETSVLAVDDRRPVARRQRHRGRARRGRRDQGPDRDGEGDRRRGPGPPARPGRDDPDQGRRRRAAA